MSITKKSLHTGQRKFLALPGRFKMAICGRRFGKTTLGMVIATDAAAAGGVVMWLYPTDDQARPVYTEISGAMDKKIWLCARNTITHRKSKGRIVFGSAGKLHSLRGPGLDLLIIDEAADVPEQVWKTICLPMLLERDGKAVLMGTPRGTGNWLHTLFESKQCDKKWSIMHAPTSANPLIKPAQLRALRDEMTELEYQQEIEAEFIDDGNAVFPGIDLHLGARLRESGRQGQRYATGIDLGRTNDYVVCASIDPHENHFAGLKLWTGTPWTVTEGRIRNHIKKFPGPAGIDATGIGSGISEDLDDLCKPFIVTTDLREYLYRELALAWERQRFTIPPHPEMIRQLRHMEWKQEDNRIVARSTTDHDDIAFAMAIGWYVRCRMGDTPLKGDAARNWMTFA